jgi:acetyl coenzyme A synthetase (ADP forming)-like protein
MAFTHCAASVSADINWSNYIVFRCFAQQWSGKKYNRFALKDRGWYNATRAPMSKQVPFTHTTTEEYWMNADDSLAPFFNPRGVVIVGVSQDPTKLGYGLARNLIQSRYPGAIHFVNPRGGTLFRQPVYPSVSEVPDPVDLATLLIPARFVPETLQICGQRGIRAAIIGAGGFRETGPQGAALEEECLSIARRFNMRLLGPNCIGLLDTHLPLDTTFLPPPGPTPGGVAFISHSGAICAAVVDWAHSQGFGLSRLVSLGNQADVNETDVLAPVAADPYTEVLNLYLEGVSDGRRFVEQASRVTHQKPIIALKVGRFESGRRAVASHTGALAGQENAFNAAFRRAGVIRADTSEEMFDWARALAWCPPPQGRAVAVLTNAGGPGVTAADALEVNGMHLAQLQDQTRAALRELLPPAASVHNPVDMLASASPGQYAESLRLLLADPGVHSVLVILPPPPMFTTGAVAKALIPVIHTVDKPVVVAVMGERLIQEAVEHFRAARVPEYRFPERAASALTVLAERTEYLARAEEVPVIRQDVDPEEVRATLAHPYYQTLFPASEMAQSKHKPSQGEYLFLPQEDIDRIFNAYGIATLPMELARTSDEAVELARKAGFPVALKVASPDIPHRSDVGGVLLNLRDGNAVAQGFHTVMQNARAARPQAEIVGVRVQRMILRGQDVIIGAVQDPQFGPLVMFGSGGVEVEGLKDVSFALAPVTREEAEYMLESTWAGRKLRGYRNVPSADRAAVVEILIRMAQLAADFSSTSPEHGPQLAEIEINPLRVLPEGHGAFAVDVRLRVKREE